MQTSSIESLYLFTILFSLEYDVLSTACLKDDNLFNFFYSKAVHSVILFH